MNTSFWMRPSGERPDGCITVYRCCFTLEETTRIRFRFSADERAQLFLDGKRLLEGPERGAPERWYYQNGQLTAGKGDHVLTARVLHLGFQHWAYAQLSVRHGFLLEEEGTSFLKEWEYQIESGCSFESAYPDWGTFPRVHLTKDHNSLILNGLDGSWLPVEYFRDERKLFPPDLPLMKYEKILPDSTKDGLFYFKEYVCVWANYRFSGKGKVRISWAETPYLTEEFDQRSLKGRKGNRTGNCFIGNFDTFEIDGDLHWFDYWWHAGHYVRIITEGDVHYEAEFHRTFYPYPEIKVSDPLEKMALSSLYNCSHETYVDCPYYEQLMYISDTRLAALYAYSVTDDHRLTAKALRLFALSQREDGSLNAQYPSRSVQTIPSFMLIYFLMLHDYYEHHGEDALIRELRPCAEKLLDFLAGSLNADHLLEMEGWNFIDWHPDWESGIPYDGSTSILNWLFVLALQTCMDLKIRPALAEKLIPEIKNAIRIHFYDEEKNLYAVDPEKKIFSEHPQVLALLADQDTRVIPGLRKQEDLLECSISFSYYYLEACRRFALSDLMQKRIQKWKKLPEEGLTTFPEEFGNPRSDCHGWGAYIMLFLKDHPEISC